MTTLAVIAKECVPGRVKTRLTPPLTPEQAASLALTSLRQTMRTVRQVDVDRRVLYLDGDVGTLDAAGFEVVHQRSGGLDVRIAALLDRRSDPILLIGMDTPQVERGVLQAAVDTPAAAWFGPASDGGFWALGLAAPRGSLVRGVPMSRSDTGRRQLRRLRRAGLAVQQLPMLTDVDTYEDARTVAGLVPATPFGLAVGGIEPGAAAASRPSLTQRDRIQLRGSFPAS